MQRISDIVGKTIISAESGQRLGSIADALLDDTRLSLVGLVVDRGMLSGEQVLPFTDVQTLGADAVLARTDSGLIGRRQWHDSGFQATRSSALKGRPVVTAGGQRVGAITDVLVDQRTGTCRAVEVSERHLGGLRTRHSLVHLPADVRIGPDAVVVPDMVSIADEGDA